MYKAQKSAPPERGRDIYRNTQVYWNQCHVGEHISIPNEKKFPTLMGTLGKKEGDPCKRETVRLKSLPNVQTRAYRAKAGLNNHVSHHDFYSDKNFD